MESPHGDPTTPGVARMSLPVCAYLPARQQCVPARPHTLACLGGQEGQPDTLSRTDSTRAVPAPPLPMPLASSALPACLPILPITPARLPCLARMCHIVNESATRASRKNGLLSSPFTLFRFSKTLHTDTQPLTILLNIMLII